jgi:hypothetical protein
VEENQPLHKGEEYSVKNFVFKFQVDEFGLIQKNEAKMGEGKANFWPDDIAKE